ncbi:hypothetical protein [Haloferax marisrubri]|uniref:Uncharacterized protein n=1 Tax=Haloferax marisrubri TaxID=1544719 RepID=A0A2P4NUH1_9EURY|nr:hypothetical protein [Haloferax marisrubri]POG56763.1 hypothetical protein AUR65_002755 [Haloferax marisrubri]
MPDRLSEPEIYVYSKRFLRGRGWTLVGGEPPGGSDGLPRIEAKHPDKVKKGSKGSKKVDIIAYRDGHLLLLELKSRFDGDDVAKLDELAGDPRWRRSFLDACEERNAFSRAGLVDSTLPARIRSGEALVKAIGVGHEARVPSEYALLTLRSPTDIDATVGGDCPLDPTAFEAKAD